MTSSEPTLNAAIEFNFIPTHRRFGVCESCGNRIDGELIDCPTVELRVVPKQIIPIDLCKNCAASLASKEAEQDARMEEAVKILRDPDIDKPKCKVCGKPLEIQNSEHWGMACTDHWDETRTDFGDAEGAKDWAFRMARWKVLTLLTTKSEERPTLMHIFPKAIVGDVQCSRCGKWWSDLRTDQCEGSESLSSAKATEIGGDTPT